eukprot:2042802-Pleurochrysis_carterae.AAC.1
MRAKYCENQLHAHRCFTSKEEYNICVYDYHNGDFREYKFEDESGAELPADGRDVPVQNSSYEFVEVDSRYAELKKEAMVEENMDYWIEHGKEPYTKKHMQDAAAWLKRANEHA